jgi:hypothetical protein|mmetsp:Transcript_59087/g.162068  ORF Transcript_59087/g.162068 Transcript_59087/m.162068 type:complete len:125 (+) Transcript_59087:1307-1681(+)
MLCSCRLLVSYDHRTVLAVAASWRRVVAIGARLRRAPRSRGRLRAEVAPTTLAREVSAGVMIEERDIACQRCRVYRLCVCQRGSPHVHVPHVRCARQRQSNAVRCESREVLIDDDVDRLSRIGC